MWVLSVLAGALLLTFGVAVLVRTQSQRTHAASAKSRAPALWENRWAAIASALLGLALIAGGSSLRDTPSVPTSAQSGARDTTDAAAAGGTPSSSGQEADPQQPSAADAYRVAVIGVNEQIAEQLGTLTGQLVAARYEDQVWLTETRSTLAAMEATADQARAIAPTTEYRSAHAAWIEGIESYDWAAENLAVAVNGPDQELMDRCMDRLESASTSLKRSMALIQKVDVE